ncbi:GyrI-like domain-containing protein [Sporomusa rhizae]|uniref:AraC family transcriptional regulator n=1 Tax=Sporomusa rhizae TaxID=357999 RepID=UPI00352AACC2
MEGQGVRSDITFVVNQAINYIYTNLDRNLTVEEIGDKCCFSKYYFNRLFKVVVGESIYSFIKRMRLERAAFQMKTSRKSITDIAVEAGYSPSNFASAFKQYFGISASEFRQMNTEPFKDSFARVAEHIQNLKKNENVFCEIDAKMQIKKIPGMRLVYKRVICNYSRELKEAWELFCKEIEEKYSLDKVGRFVGISYDDPLIVDEDRCIYDMCMEVDEASGLNVYQIETGIYACYEFYDKPDKLILTFNEIFSLWLPFCNYELDNRPSLEIYHSGIDEKGNIHATICLPIQQP